MFQMSIIEMCIQCTFCMKKKLMFFGIGQMHSCIEGVSNYKVGLSVKAGQDYGLIAKEKPHYDKRSSCHRSISCTMEQPLQPLSAFFFPT